jgi:hypothetical protein
MIVRARIDGATYWLDPTNSHQGGRLDQIVAPDVGFALPIDPEAAAIEPVRRTDEMIWATNVIETYFFRDRGVTLDVRWRLSGAGADWWRYRLATEGRRKLEDELLDFYRGRHPGLEMSASMEVNDDRDNNVIATEEHYGLTPEALHEDSLFHDFVFGAEDFTKDLRDAFANPRAAAYLMGQPRRNSHEVRVRNAPIEFAPPDPVRISNPVFDYEMKGKAEPGGVMTLRWSFRSDGRVVQPEQADTVRRDTRLLRDSYSYSWDLDPDAGR